MITPATGPFSRDEESSGIIAVSDIFGEGNYLLDVQAHYNIGNAELVEGGQVLLMNTNAATAELPDALNILAPKKLSTLSTPQALHTYLEASALSFADRGAYVGDPAYVNVPTKELLSPGFGAERSCLIDPAKASSTNPAKRGENTASPSLTRLMAAMSSSPVMVLVT